MLIISKYLFEPMRYFLKFSAKIQLFFDISKFSTFVSVKNAFSYTFYTILSIAVEYYSTKSGRFAPALPFVD